MKHQHQRLFWPRRRPRLR